MIVAKMWVIRVRLFGGFQTVASERENGPEEEVLYYWELAKYFCKIHLDHSGIDFVPCLNSGDVVKHWGVPT